MMYFSLLVFYGGFGVGAPMLRSGTPMNSSRGGVINYLAVTLTVSALYYSPPSGYTKG